MYVIKRNSSEALFDASKIETAIRKANNSPDVREKISDTMIKAVTENVVKHCEQMERAVNVEEIQDQVERELMRVSAYDLADAYIKYRFKRSTVRQANTTDEKILSLIGRTNEEAKQENANKNPTIVSTQRDYMAGEVSKDLVKRFMMPEYLWEAHENGLIHIHDTDYIAQNMHNCCLVNLEDMLQNGTVISGTLIERPHSFATACNIATQIVAQVASSQFGGQTITLSHLAPFVDVSRQKIRRKLLDELRSVDVTLTEEQIANIVEGRVRDEVARGVQTIQYQIITLMTTNG